MALARLLLVAFFSLLCGAAQAVIPPTWGYTRPGNATVYPSGQDACTALAESMRASYPNAVGVAYGKDGDAQRWCAVSNGAGYGYPSTNVNRVGMTCPAFSEMAGADCVCKAGFFEENQQCKPIPDCGVGKVWNPTQNVCEPIPEPPLCNPPNILIGNYCKPPEDPSCPSPNVMVNGVCTPPCPSTMTRIDGVCKCPAGQVYTEGKCQPPKCPHPLGTALGGEGQYTSANYGGGTFCYSSCVVYPSFAGKDQTSGKWFANGPLTSTGVACTGGPTGGPGLPPEQDPTNPGPGDPPPPKEPPKPCPSGKCPGTVNGVEMCVPCSEGKNTTTTTTTTNTTGDTSGGNTGGGDTGGSDTGSKDGTSTTKTTTQCADGKCTTTKETTTTKPDGTTSTQTQTKEEPKQSFCTENPKSPLCAEGSFGGSCEAQFQCQGDPVQCAQAKAANEARCAMTNLPVEVSSVTQSLMNFDMATLHEAGPSLTGPSQVSGTCSVSDFSVSMPFGQSMTVRLSQVCTFIDTIRAVIGVMGALAFAVIVFKQ